jgi:TetR/AcrR family transcriptional regulator
VDSLPVGRRRTSTPPDRERTLKESILDEATRLFASKGFAATSVQRIATGVGIRKPSLLYWFRNKETLREEVVERLLSRWKDVIPEILRAATTGENRFDAAMDEFIRFFQEDPDRARLLLRELLDRPDEMRERIERHLMPFISLLTAYIERGQKEGLIHPHLDPEAYVMEVVVLVLATLGTQTVVLHSAERRIAELKRISHDALFIQPWAPENA